MMYNYVSDMYIHSYELLYDIYKLLITPKRQQLWSVFSVHLNNLRYTFLNKQEQQKKIKKSRLLITQPKL